MKYDVLKNFLSEITPDKESKGIESTIKSIEKHLCDAEWSHKRILYLEALEGTMSDFPDIANIAIKNPLTHDQNVKCVEKGFVKAFSDGDVTFEQIVQLSHSAEGLSAFTDTLVEVPEASRADCWKTALTTPFEPPKSDLTKIEPPTSMESAWEQITKVVNQWLESLVPPRLVPSLGYRGIKAGEAKFDLGNTIEQDKTISKQLNSLKAMVSEIDDREVVRVFKRIPWKKLGEFLDEKSTWETFLQQVGIVFHTEMHYKDIRMLTEWVPKGVQSLPQYKSEIKLLEILLRSTDLVRM